MDERERSALRRLSKGFLASILVFVGVLGVSTVVGVTMLVTGYQFTDYQVDVSMMLSVIVAAALVGLFIMALILLGLRDLSQVDGSFIVGYVGMLILMLGYSARVLVTAAALLTGEAMLEAVQPIMDNVIIAMAVGYVAAFVFSAVRLWMRYRDPLYMVAAIFYTAAIATSLLFQIAPPLFAIIASALMYSALRATIRGDVDS